MSKITVTITGGAIDYTTQGITKTFTDTQALCKYLESLQLNADTIDVTTSGSLTAIIKDVDYQAREPGIN